MGLLHPIVSRAEGAGTEGSRTGEKPGAGGMRPSAGVGMAVCAAAMVASAAAFLPKQSIWVDEGTQLVGIRLGPVEVARWLAGADRRDFGQFRDRMPPLSYWLGWCWARAFGADVTSLRWLSVLYAAGAAAATHAAARRAFGPAAAQAAGLVFALSPSVVVLAVEVRPYSLFLLCSAVAFFFLVRLVSDREPRRGDVMGLSAALAAAILTHFFGLVLAGGMLVALAAFAAAGAGRWRSVVAVAVVVAASAAAIVPFVVEALGMGHGIPPRGGRLDHVLATSRLLTGLTSHPALAMVPPVAVACPAAAGALAILALPPLGRRRRAQLAVALVLASGLAAVAAAKLTLASLDAARPTYNAWTWPAISLLLASGLGGLRPRARRAAGLAAGALVVGRGIGAIELARHGASFAHTPHRAIARLIRESGQQDVAVIHDDPSHHFVHLSNPLHYEFGAALRQYRLDNAALPGRPTELLTYEGAWVKGRPAGPVVDLLQPVLIVLHSRNMSPGALLDRVRRGIRFEADGPAARDLRASPSWRLVDRRSALAEHSAEILVFRRAGPAQALGHGAAPSMVARRPSAPAPAAGPDGSHAVR